MRPDFGPFDLCHAKNQLTLGTAFTMRRHEKLFP